MSFGRNGPHLCLGAWLARMELRLVFEELMKRVDHLEPDGPTSPTCGRTSSPASSISP